MNKIEELNKQVKRFFKLKGPQGSIILATLSKRMQKELPDAEKLVAWHIISGSTLPATSLENMPFDTDDRVVERELEALLVLAEYQSLLENFVLMKGEGGRKKLTLLAQTIDKEMHLLVNTQLFQLLKQYSLPKVDTDSSQMQDILSHFFLEEHFLVFLLAENLDEKKFLEDLFSGSYAMQKKALELLQESAGKLLNSPKGMVFLEKKSQENQKK